MKKKLRLFIVERRLQEKLNISLSMVTVYFKNVNSKQRYLGPVLEYLSFNTTSDVSAEAAGRALGGVRFKVKYIKDCGYSSIYEIV